MRYLILLLSLISFSISAQTLLPVPSTPTTQNINSALSGSIAAAGTDTYTASLTGLASYTGFAADFQFTNANTSTTCSINITGATVLGAKSLKKYSSGSLVDLAVGDISSGARIRFYYNGTYLVMMGGSSSGSGGVTTTAPLTGTTALGITQATTSTDGYLSSTDWNLFHGKQDALVSGTNIKTINGTSILGSGNISTGSGSGTVSDVSIVTTNGFAGSVATSTTTPAITISTSVTGIVKGNGTAISGATSGTDYSLGTSALATGIIKSTTSTGNLSIAVAGDFPTLNQNTTGSAGTATALANPRTISITGDLAYTSPSFDGTGNVTAAGTLATVNSNVGSFGTATQSPTVTVNGKGLVTAISNTTITPAIGSVTGLGTGVATALAVNVGSAGAPLVFNGAGGTPSSMTATNLTGLPVSTGISGLGSGVATFLGAPTTANLSSTIGTQTANTFFSGPSSGSASNATFRTQVIADLPFDEFITDATTTRTLSATDRGKIIRFTSNSPITVTLPNGITQGFECVLVKAGTGDITLTAGTTLEGSTIVSGTAPSFAVIVNRGSDIWMTNGASTANVTGVGTLDAQTKSADGAVVSSSSIFLQSADATNPGLVSISAQTWTGDKSIDGNVTIKTVGKGLLIKEGTNSTMGVATLVSGSIVVSTTKVTANSRIFLTVQSLGTVVIPTAIAVTARSAGATFTITSAGATDTSVVAWEIVEPAP